MNGRSFRDCILACAGMAVAMGWWGLPVAQAASNSVAEGPSAKVPFAQDPADPLGMDTSDDLTFIDAADWKPEHTLQVEVAATGNASNVKSLEDAKSAVEVKSAVDSKAPEKSVQTSTDKGADDSDPEPDAVVVPSTPSPSHDPLDKPKPAAAAPVQPDAAKTAEEPLPTLNAAVKAALDKRGAAAIKGPNAVEQRKQREAVTFHYAAHGFAPAWSENGKASDAVSPVLARLAAAGEDALTLTGVPADLNTTGTPEDIAASDLALTETVVAYARQATGSRIQPRAISPLIGAKPDLADPAEVVDALVAAGADAGDKLRALNPTEPRYIALREKLAELRGGSAHEDAPAIPDGPALTVGMRDPRVPLLRARFGVEATADEADADLVYDAAVAAAVSDFQRTSGLSGDGVLGNRTIAALGGHGSPQGKSPEASIIANMEMWRWMPRDLGSDRIEVNVPDYVVRVFHDNQPVASNRVVVGKLDTPTPLFSNEMKFLIVNPVWNVPQSIIKNEMGGAERRGFKARYVHGQLYLQQAAGPGNALGRIKFMFPNEYSVYLHDTPVKRLFGASKRAFSHGCVRVDKPFDFAESVLNDAVPEGGRPRWSQKRLESMLGTTERYVNLPKPLPIHIEYFTAKVDDSGRLTTSEDVYGYTAAVAAALGLRGDISNIAVAGRTPKHVADGGSHDGAAATEHRTKRSRGRAARRLAERAQERDRQAYVPPAETGRGGLFGFLPF